MPVFVCNILQGVLITEPFWICLVASPTLGEGILVQILCRYAREKWGSQFSPVVCEDCLEVCLVGLVVETMYGALS